MNVIGDQLSALSSFNQLTVPDLWQQKAVAELRRGRDVVVHAPTGAGKTLIFELWSNGGRNRGQCIYTVPTRALANDKLAEWRARGWDVGITTGDLSENLNAPVLVATLETQKNKLIRGEGPTLLVVDEYQLIGDAERGLNYELALAMAPASTQLLLLSGSVGNPQDLVAWLRRIGRDAVLVRHEQRPVPLEEVHTNHLNFYVPDKIRGYWPRLVAKCLAEDLGPILIFAPHRQTAESMAAELARQLPTPNPLALSPEQRAAAGETLAKMLKSRIAYHHSGLSYRARAGVVEPLAKAGQLRVVVATMGLAAGINFSLRSVALAGESYRRDHLEQPIRPDEILQMFGRAGRRGLDETGYVLITANQLRLMDGWACHLARSGAVDWSALLNLMALAAENQRPPFPEAVHTQQRLFTTKPIFLGVESSLQHPNPPCGLHTDPERARHVRKRLRQMLNSQGQWEALPSPIEVPLGQVLATSSPAPMPNGDPLSPPGIPELVPALSIPAAVERVGHGNLIALNEASAPPLYGRSMLIADRIAGDKLLIAKWVRRSIQWPSRQAQLADWNDSLAPRVASRLEADGLPVIRFDLLENKVCAAVSLAKQTIRTVVDSHGVALWKPHQREVLPLDCAQCDLVPICRDLPTTTGVALTWKRLGLIQADGRPTRRGRLVSFFSHGDGLAIAAALEQSAYPLEELIYELANINAGYRFCGEESRWTGRLALACQQTYNNVSIPGYLENGLPPKYGAGAEQVVAGVHKNPMNKHLFVTQLLGPGDIDRAIIEWRSLLRQIAHAPSLEWARWTELQEVSRLILNETQSPTEAELPPLEQHQTKRVDHRLILRRH